jgi:transcriptional regulator with XRE-family HTH domain
MEELKDILPRRLAEIFKDETQQVTAEKLDTVQGTISKWLTGGSFPPSEMLFTIAKKYKVSVDWLMGLSDEKEVGAVNVKKLTYEQISLVIHRLIELGSIEVLDMAHFNPTLPGYADEVEKEADEPKESKYDPDYIRITDMGLSYLLRTRWKLREIDDETMDFWLENYVKRFNGVRIVKFDEKKKKFLNAKPWSTFKAGDWASLLNDMGREPKETIETSVKKEGRSNGR